MKWLKRILLSLLTLVFALCAIAFFLPNHAHVERSISVARKPGTVFAILDSFRRFNDWSPWSKIDPKARYTYSGPESGVGAKFSWEGNSEIGKGSDEIVERDADKRIKVALDFGDHGKYSSSFELKPEGNAGTRVTWSFDGDLPLALDGKFFFNCMGRWFGLAFDSMIGKDYDRGLAGLKALAETLPEIDLGGFSADVVELKSQPLLIVTTHSGLDTASASPALAEAYGQIGAAIKAGDVTMQGPAMTITHSVDNGVWNYDAAVAVDRVPEAPAAPVQVGAYPEGKALATIHVGSYDKIGDTLTKLDALMKARGYNKRGELVAEYVDDPGKVPMDQVKTRLVQPVQ